MKDKKKKIIVIIASILVVAGLIIYYFIHSYDSNLIEINYNELKEKIDNKEDFVLCVSRTTCIHCQDYKPKLKKVGYKYKIDIYYIDVDLLNDDELKMFKNTVSFDGSTPITIFFKNGEEKTTATRIEGDVSEEKLISKLKTNGFIK